MNTELSDLYQKIILAHNKNPFHFEKIEDVQINLEAYNPLCGDHFHIYLHIEEQQIKNAHFHGYGCAICKASTSVMIQHIITKRLDEVQALSEMFLKVAHDKITEQTAIPEEFQAFAAAKNFPSRIDCATLSWDTFLDFLKKMNKT